MLRIEQGVFLFSFNSIFCIKTMKMQGGIGKFTEQAQVNFIYFYLCAQVFVELFYNNILYFILIEKMNNEGKDNKASY